MQRSASPSSVSQARSRLLNWEVTAGSDQERSLTLIEHRRCNSYELSGSIDWCQIDSGAPASHVTVISSNSTTDLTATTNTSDFMA